MSDENGEERQGQRDEGDLGVREEGERDHGRKGRTKSSGETGGKVSRRGARERSLKIKPNLLIL